MIKQLKLKLQPESDVHIENAYYLYGALMQRLDPLYAEALHTQGIKPVTHYIEKTKSDSNEFTWVVNMLNEEAINYIEPVIKEIDEVFIENYNCNLKLMAREESAFFTEENLVEEFLIRNEPIRRINIIHKTPCSFKSNEKYVLFPSEELIIKSAVQKWNAFATKTVIDDPDAILQIIEHTQISGFNLRSGSYNIKGNRIPGFLGRTTLYVRGPEALVRLSNLLIFFLQYSGLGIKASLGMGGCVVK